MIDDLYGFSEKGLKKEGGDITQSFFKNAKVALKEEKTLGKISGQTENYTCVANSLRMVLDDLGYLRSEKYLTEALNTILDGAKILDIPIALKNSYIDNIQTIARGGGKDRIGVKALENQLKQGKKAIVSVWTKEFGAHAIVVDKIENGRVFVRDPLPLNQGSSYSVDLVDFMEVFNKKFVSFKTK